jgi:CBS domain-containing protein
MGTLEKLLSGRPLLTLAGSASALDAARAMASGPVGSILIVDGERRPVGIFTERDLMTRVIVAGLDCARTRLEDVMTRELLLGRVDDSIDAAQREMQRRHVRHLPIVGRDGRALAMLSLRDLLRYDLAEREHEVEALHDYLAGPETPPSSSF